MTEPVPTLDIAAPQLVIVAEGETSGAQSNARGHLFEKFIARLFQALGCESPSASSLNVKQNGYELDVAMRIALTGEPAIAECKAYSSPLPSQTLSAFYGKLHTERLDSPETRGWFVAIPGLTSDGHTLARKLEKGDTKFRLLTATNIYALVQERGWIEPIQEDESTTLSDHAILISTHGVAALAKQIDRSTRLPIRVLVSRSSEAVSQPELRLLSASDYAAGLDVYDVHAPRAADVQAAPSEAITLVTVVGSREDFEYQFPASPAYFVGREALLAQVRRASDDHRDRGSSVVLNAQSGWGKSSLALRTAYEIERGGGSSIVFDSRTASSVPFVASALRRALAEAQNTGLLQLPQDASFASLQSAVRTLQSCRWMRHAQLLIFFDQFENVFRDQRLTQEFRDLVLAVREVTSPVMLGFCWKTDLVGMTENYPYRLRDEIRSVSLVLNVEPFGPKDVNTLLGRLARAAGHDLSADLKQRLREYSQGLPWLLKKLASHILKELQSGTSEESLLADSLNIESLFQQDLASLEAREQEALRTIAREAPVLVSDIVERVDPGVIQSLVDQRLVVRVGERIDVYWDTFREFLITGKLSVEDTYILRLRAASTSKLLQLIVRQGGEATVQEATASLSTTQHVIFNSSRELRLLGILSPRSGVLTLSEQFRGRDLREAEIRERVAQSLRRHAVFGKIQQLISTSAKSETSIDALAAEMPALFPAVAATPKTWRIYAISFGTWLDYSGLLRLRGQMLSSAEAGSQVALLASVESHRRGKTFPHSRPDASLAYLRSLRASQSIELTKSARQKVSTDLFVLGVLDLNGRLVGDQSGLIDRLTSEPPDAAAIRQVLLRVPGGAEALAQLTADPAARPELIGATLRDMYGLPWAPSTTKMAGDKFRAWARSAGVSVAIVPRRPVGAPEHD
ncbi:MULTISPECIES: AAA family ATPase [unclassified Paraburkholderia]|uniref:nSTAND1 domain-containing NTPase n=1 Tax=unclassified Paraburkholderia TaxID=2615204 RepID=UPI002AAFE593|nr:MULTISPECIES: AAA family ATPase [unclassified Paraburkholderia]